MTANQILEPEEWRGQVDACGLIGRLCEKLGSDLWTRAQLDAETNSDSRPRAELGAIREVVSEAVAFRAALSSLHGGVHQLVEELTLYKRAVSAPWLTCAGPLIQCPVGPLLADVIIAWLDSDPPLDRLVDLKDYISRGLKSAPRHRTVWKSVERAHATALMRAAYAVIGEVPPPSRTGKDNRLERDADAEFEGAPAALRQLSRNETNKLSGTGTLLVVAEELSQWFGAAVSASISMVHAKAIGPDDHKHLEAVSRCAATVIEWTLRLEDLLRQVAERIAACPVSPKWVYACWAFRGHAAGADLGNRLMEWMCADERTLEELDRLRDSVPELREDDDYEAARILQSVRKCRFRFRARDFLHPCLVSDC